MNESDLTHYIEQLQVYPAFNAYEAELAGRFDARVRELLDDENATPHVMAQRVGRLRGLRDAMREPERIARVARENDQ
jgi:hypothetical protein